MDEKLKALYDKIKEIWSKNKIFFFILIPVFLLAKFKDVLIDLLVDSSRKMLGAAKKDETALKQSADAANQQANKLIQDANKKSENKSSVDEDWYKN